MLQIIREDSAGTADDRRGDHMFVVDIGGEPESSFQRFPTLDHRVIESPVHGCDQFLCRSLRSSGSRSTLHQLQGLVVLELLQDGIGPQ